MSLVTLESASLKRLVLKIYSHTYLRRVAVFILYSRHSPSLFKQTRLYKVYSSGTWLQLPWHGYATTNSSTASRGLGVFALKSTREGSVV